MVSIASTLLTTVPLLGIVARQKEQYLIFSMLCMYTRYRSIRSEGEDAQKKLNFSVIYDMCRSHSHVWCFTCNIGERMRGKYFIHWILGNSRI